MTDISSNRPLQIASAAAPGGPGGCSEDEMNYLLIETMKLSQKVGNALNQIGQVMGNNSLSVAQKVTQIQNLKAVIDQDIRRIDQHESDYDNCNDGDRMRSAEFARLARSARLAQASAGQNLGNLQNQMRNHPEFANIPVGELVERAKQMAGDAANWTSGALQNIGNFLLGLGAGVLGAAWWVLQQMFGSPDRAQADGPENTQPSHHTIPSNLALERQAMGQLT